MIIVLVFVIAMGTLFFADMLPAVICAFYLAASIITFAFYAFDKRAATNNRRRTPESTLHVLSLIGGWPGAIIAQQKLRHKTVKQPFRRIFWATAILNLAALAWLLATPSGIQFQTMLG